MLEIYIIGFVVFFIGAIFLQFMFLNEDCAIFGMAAICWPLVIFILMLYGVFLTLKKGLKYVN
jgi:hypothetical protein